MKLSNNKIIITGATRGIGLALLDEFHKRDNIIIAVARNEARLSALQEKYPNIVTIAADLNNEEAINNLVKIIKEEHPDTNTLINNAGIQVNFYENNFGEDDHRMNEIAKEIQVNFHAPIELTYRLIPTLRKNTNAAVVNVTSGLMISPKKSAPVYCATKAGLHSFTKALRYQYEDTNLSVFEIIPPLVDTDMTTGRGSGKITPEQLVREFIASYKQDKYEVYIGKSKILKMLKRILPRVADNILKDS